MFKPPSSPASSTMFKTPSVNSSLSTFSSPSTLTFPRTQMIHIIVVPVDCWFVYYDWAANECSSTTTATTSTTTTLYSLRHYYHVWRVLWISLGWFGVIRKSAQSCHGCMIRTVPTLTLLTHYHFLRTLALHICPISSSRVDKLTRFVGHSGY